MSEASLSSPADPSPTTRPPWPEWIGPLALFLAIGYQVASALQPLDFLLSNVFQMDDAYYYLQVARNVADHGFVSFDGIHATSGIQPLWTVLLSGLAFLVPGKVAFLRAVMLFSTAINALTGWQLGRLGRTLHSPAVGGAVQTLWAGFLFALAPTVIAMEYPLYMLTVVCLLSASWRLWRIRESPSPARFLPIGLGLALLFWVRLDSAFFSVLIAGVLILRFGHSMRAADYFALLLPSLIGAALYVGACEWVAHTPMPISGLVKKHYSALHFQDHPWWLALAGHILWYVQVNARPLLDVVSSGLTETRPWTHPLNVGILTAMLAVALWGVRAVSRAQDQSTRPLAFFLALLLVAALAHAALVVSSVGHFAGVTQHYYGWSLIAWMLWSALLVALLAKRWRPAPFVLLAVVLGQGCLVARQHLAYEGHVTSLHRRRAPAIEWIEREIPADARLGAWNAGQFGYFCDRAVVNLDGLANDREYLEFLRSGRPVLEYLEAEGIDYVVDTHSLDLTMPYGTELAPDDDFRGVLPREPFEVVWRESDNPRAITILRRRR